MNDTETRVRAKGGRLRMPRSRGAASGLLLVLLGAWGAAAPFIGPRLNFAFQPDVAWTSSIGWLEVLPGALAALGGVLLLISRNRATATLGGWLAVIAGAWFVVGRAAAGPLGLGGVGAPTAGTEVERLWLELAYFQGLGALIVLLGAFALGRVSVRSARDIAYAERHVVTRDPALTATDADATTDSVRTAHERPRLWALPFRRTAAH